MQDFDSFYSDLLRVIDKSDITSFNDVGDIVDTFVLDNLDTLSDATVFIEEAGTGKNWNDLDVFIINMLSDILVDKLAIDPAIGYLAD